MHFNEFRAALSRLIAEHKVDEYVGIPPSDLSRMLTDQVGVFREVANHGVIREKLKSARTLEQVNEALGVR